MPTCARCNREVYFAEQKVELGKVWHKFCFSCYKCRKLLDSCSVNTYCGEIFCNPCYKTCSTPCGTPICKNRVFKYRQKKSPFSLVLGGHRKPVFMKIYNGCCCSYGGDDPCCKLLPRQPCRDPCCNCCLNCDNFEVCCRTSCYNLWPTMPKTQCDPKPACLDECNPPTILLRCYSCCPPKKCCLPNCVKCPPDPCCCPPPPMQICCPTEEPCCCSKKRCCAMPQPREILNYYSRNHMPVEPEVCKGTCLCKSCCAKDPCCPPKCPPEICCPPNKCFGPYTPPCRKPICYPPIKICEDKCIMPRERICYTPCPAPKQPNFCTCGMPNPCDCNLVERSRQAKCANSPCCRRCGEKVFAAEKIMASGGAFHTSCFTCYCCNKPLEVTTIFENQGEIYCKCCYTKFFGIKGYGFGTTLQSII